MPFLFRKLILSLLHPFTVHMDFSDPFRRRSFPPAAKMVLCFGSDLFLVVRSILCTEHLVAVPRLPLRETGDGVRGTGDGGQCSGVRWQRTGVRRSPLLSPHHLLQSPLPHLFMRFFCVRYDHDRQKAKDLEDIHPGFAFSDLSENHLCPFPIIGKPPRNVSDNRKPAPSRFSRPYRRRSPDISYIKCISYMKFYCLQPQSIFMGVP